MLEKLQGNLDLLQASYAIAPQYNNLWDLTLEDWSNSVYTINKFNVISTSLPFVVALESEARSTGENYYTDFSYPSGFSVEFRENAKFTIHDYFKRWMLQVFNPLTGNFISSSTSKTRTGTLTFYSYKMNPEVYKIFSAQYVTNKIKNLQTVASQTLIQQAKKQASANLPYPMGYIASQGASIVSSKVQSGINSLMPKFDNMFEEVVTKTFTIENIRFLGMDETSLDYTGGDQLTLKVNFAADRFYDTELKQYPTQRRYV